MAEHLLRTISDLEADIQAQEQAVRELKRTVNHLCRRAGIGPKFDDAAIDTAATIAHNAAAIEPDRYVGKALNSAIKDFLSGRKAAGLTGPASPEEIYDALERGGFEFGNKDKGAALNGLRISLGKSSHTFRKVQNGLYGLHEWYGTKPPRAASRKATNGTAVAGGNDDGEREEQEGES